MQQPDIQELKPADPKLLDPQVKIVIDSKMAEQVFRPIWRELRTELRAAKDDLVGEAREVGFYSGLGLGIFATFLVMLFAFTLVLGRRKTGS